MPPVRLALGALAAVAENRWASAAHAIARTRSRPRTDTAKDIAAKVAHGASTLLDATKEKAKEAKRAIRDGVIHTNDKLEDLTDKID